MIKSDLRGHLSRASQAPYWLFFFFIPVLVWNLELPLFFILRTTVCIRCCLCCYFRATPRPAQAGYSPGAVCGHLTDWLLAAEQGLQAHGLGRWGSWALEGCGLHWLQGCSVGCGMWDWTCVPRPVCYSILHRWSAQEASHCLPLKLLSTLVQKFLSLSLFGAALPTNCPRWKHSLAGTKRSVHFLSQKEQINISVCSLNALH